MPSTVVLVAPRSTTVAGLSWTIELLPHWHTGSMLKNVAAVLLDGVHPFELGVVCEVFGIDRSDDGLPVYDFAVVLRRGPGAGTARRASPSARPARPRAAGVGRPRSPCPPAAATRPASTRRSCSRPCAAPSTAGPGCSASAPAPSCSARPGCSTAGAAPPTGGTPRSWPRRYPRPTVEPDVLYVDEDPVITSAGTAAGIDACLHLVRQEHGPEVANRSPGGWSCRRTGTAARPSTSSARCRARPCDTVGEVLVVDGAAPRPRRSPSSSSPTARTCRRAPSPAASSRRPAPPRYRWSCASGCCWPSELLEATDETVDAIAGGRVRQRGRAAPPVRAGAGHHPERLPAHLPGPGGRRLTPCTGRGPSARASAAARAGCRVMPTRVASSDPGTCSKRYSGRQRRRDQRQQGHREMVARALAVAHAERASSRTSGTSLTRSGSQRSGSNSRCSARTTADRAGSRTGCTR